MFFQLSGNRLGKRQQGFTQRVEGATPGATPGGRAACLQICPSVRAGCSDNMSGTKAAAVIGLGVGAMLIAHVGEPLDSLGSGYPTTWSQTAGWHGAPERAVLCTVAGVFLLMLSWLYRLLFCPLEILRSPDDVGYIAEDGRTRAQAANEVRRRRKVGDLPPVYPNGWYRVLDSHLLERGQVKNVTVLGMMNSSCCTNSYHYLINE